METVNKKAINELVEHHSKMCQKVEALEFENRNLNRFKDYVLGMNLFQLVFWYFKK